MQGNLKSFTFAPGQFVFAKCQNYKPWPAKIKSISLALVINKKKEEYIYQVIYFGATSKAFHQQNELEPFDINSYKKYEEKYKESKNKQEKQVLKVMKSVWTKYTKAVESGLVKPASLYKPILITEPASKTDKAKSPPKSKSQLSKSRSTSQKSKTMSKVKKNMSSVKIEKKNKSMSVSKFKSKSKGEKSIHVLSKESKSGKKNRQNEESPSKLKKPKSNEKREKSQKKKNNSKIQLKEQELEDLLQMWSEQSKRARLEKKKKEKNIEIIDQPPKVPAFHIYNHQKFPRKQSSASDISKENSQTHSSKDIKLNSNKKQRSIIKIGKISSQKPFALQIVKNEKKSQQYVKLEHKEQNNIDSSTDELNINDSDYTKLIRTLNARIGLIKNTPPPILCALANKYFDTMTYQLQLKQVEDVLIKTLSMKKKQTLMAIIKGKTVTLSQIIKAKILHAMFNFISAFHNSNTYLTEVYEMEYHSISPMFLPFLKNILNNSEKLGLTEEQKADYETLLKKFNDLGTMPYANTHVAPSSVSQSAEQG